MRPKSIKQFVVSMVPRLSTVASFLLVLASRVVSKDEPFQEPCQNGEGTFLYYAYGSNLLAERIHINNPSAVFVGPAALVNYRLDFTMNSTMWRGAVATVVPEPNSKVWGALWTMHCDDLPNIDRQEGVHENWYYAESVRVVTPQGKRLIARTYIQTENPERGCESCPVPVHRRPSLTYFKVILLGAVQCGLPETYVRYLYSMPHNGQVADKRILSRLNGLETVSVYPAKYDDVTPLVL